MGIRTGTKEFIKYAVGDDTLAPLKKRSIEFGDETPQTIIVHLRDKVCLKLTAPEKYNLKRIRYQKRWDATQNILTYFKYLDNFQDRLDTRVIPTTKSEKIMAATARMYQSGYFIQANLIDWENKSEVDKMWVNVKNYFTDLYQSQEQYTKVTAKSSIYREETNHVGSGNDAQTVGLTITTGEETAMIMASLQDTHAKKLNPMREANDKSMTMATQAMQNMADQMKVMQETSAR